MAINKVVYGDQVLIDLTGDTVTADKLLKGFTAHGKDGSPIEGACTFDVDSKDATAAVAEILAGKTAYARGAMLTGTMLVHIPKEDAMRLWNNDVEMQFAFTTQEGRPLASDIVRMSVDRLLKEAGYGPD